MEKLGERMELFGVPVDLLSEAQVLEVVDACVRSGARAHIMSVNAHQLLLARRDGRYLEELRQARLCHVDGSSIQIAMRFLYGRSVEKIAGIDLMLELLRTVECGVYFLGAKRDVLEDMICRLRAAHPLLCIAGHHDGYFAEAERAGILEDIRRSGARLVFIGMPSPQRDAIAAELQTSREPLVLMDVGGSFDVVAGRYKRAPKWMIDFKLEWLYRMLKEPGRLLGRNLRDFPAFLGLMLLEKIKLLVKGNANKRWS